MDIGLGVMAFQKSSMAFGQGGVPISSLLSRNGFCRWFGTRLKEKDGFGKAVIFSQHRSFASHLLYTYLHLLQEMGNGTQTGVHRLALAIDSTSNTQFYLMHSRQ